MAYKNFDIASCLDNRSGILNSLRTGMEEKINKGEFLPIERTAEAYAVEIKDHAGAITFFGITNDIKVWR